MARAKESENLMETLVTLCKRRGIIFQSSEIYSGINGFYDYGPLGVEMRRNIKSAWWQDFVHRRDDIVGLDSTIIHHPTTWKASGHIDNFTDPLVDCKASKQRYRADQIFFAPVVIDGERYVDGGVASACNADVLADEELDAVIISAPMAIHSGPRWAADALLRRALRRQVNKEMSALKKSGKQVFLFAPIEQDAAVMGTNPMGEGKAAAVAQSVHRSALTRIKADSRLRSLRG